MFQHLDISTYAYVNIADGDYICLDSIAAAVEVSTIRWF